MNSRIILKKTSYRQIEATKEVEAMSTAEFGDAMGITGQKEIEVPSRGRTKVVLLRIHLDEYHREKDVYSSEETGRK